MSGSYPNAVVDHVASQRRGQVVGFLFELAKLFAERQAFGVHDYVEQGNGSTCVVCGLPVVMSVCHCCVRRVWDLLLGLQTKHRGLFPWVRRLSLQRTRREIPSRRPEHCKQSV